MRYLEGFSVVRDVVHEPGAGQVLVIDGAGLATGALFGDRLAEIAVRNGWAGWSSMDWIRDRDEINAMDIGVKALGTIPVRANIQGPGERDVVVAFEECASFRGCASWPTGTASSCCRRASRKPAST